MKIGLNTSLDSSLILSFSFWQSRYLKANRRTNTRWLHKVLSVEPEFNSQSTYCLMNTIIQKYALMLSLTNNGENIKNQDVFSKQIFSTLSTRSMENIVTHTNQTQTSNIDTTNQRKTSFCRNNMSNLTLDSELSYLLQFWFKHTALSFPLL